MSQEDESNNFNTSSQIIRSNDHEEEDFENDPLYKRFSVDVTGTNKEDVELENTRYESLADARLINSIDMAILLTALKLLPNNLERLKHLDEFKLPFLFTSQNVIDIMNITLSVKTRLSILALLGPRLVDPTAKLREIIDSFRFSEEKERVEGILKKRSSILGSAIYKKSEAKNSLIRSRRSSSDFTSTMLQIHNSPNTKNALESFDDSFLPNSKVGITPSKVINDKASTVPSTPSIRNSNQSNGWTPPDNSVSPNESTVQTNQDENTNTDLRSISPKTESLPEKETSSISSIPSSPLEEKSKNDENLKSDNKQQQSVQKKQSRRGSFPPSSNKNSNEEKHLDNNDSKIEDLSPKGGCCVIS